VRTKFKLTGRNKQKFLYNEEWKEVDLQKKEDCDEGGDGAQVEFNQEER